MYASLQKNYPSLVKRKLGLFLIDKARLYTARTTLKNIEELKGIELLSHSAYSPDLFR